jgi:hypothetical protein
VYSSTTWSSFSVRPSMVVSNWKSKAHMVGALGSQPLGGHDGLAEPLAFPLPHRPTLGVQLCRTLNFNGGTVTAAASWPRRASGPEQEHSKSNSSRAPALRGP